jgi:hypothetical protein
MTRTALVLLAGLLAWIPAAQAQELACRVSINRANLQQADLDYLDDFPRIVEEYLNNERWTNDRFEDFERIACNIQIAFQSAPTQTSFVATFVLNSQRPIYGTRQATTMLNVQDEGWEFEFIQGQTLTRDQSRFDRLASLLDYYAYLMLGYDYDSFAPLGGTPFFEQAQEIATQAQASGAAGWTAFGADRTRSQIVQEMTDPRLLPLRRAYYEVHRRGLDIFVQEPEAVRANLLAVLTSFDELSDQTSNPYVFDIFFQTKSAEMVGMLTGAPQASQAYSLLLKIDPTRAAQYQVMVN